MCQFIPKAKDLWVFLVTYYKVKINSNVNEMKNMKVVNEKSNNVANVMNDTDTLKENYSHNISVVELPTN